MDTQLRKRSVIIAGHRTSVSLEQPFWEALRTIARQRGQSVNAVIAEVDALRGHTPRGATTNLSSALRVYILSHYMQAAGQPMPETDAQRREPVSA